LKSVAQSWLGGVTTWFRKAGFPVRNPFFFDILYLPLEAREDYSPLVRSTVFLIFVIYGKLPQMGRISSEMALETKWNGAIPTTSGLRAETALFKEG